MRRLALFGLALLLSIGCKRHAGRASAAAQPTVATEVRDRALKLSRATAIVRSLVDEVGPRMSGSTGDERAVAWAVRTMNELGLKNVHTERVEVPHWERGDATASLIEPIAQPLVLAALGGSVGTPEGGVEGEVVRVASLEALAALSDDAVRGKIVFFDKPMARTKDGMGYGTAVDVRGRGPMAAAKKGALAVVIRSVGTSSSRFPHTGALRYDDAVPKIPAAALAVPDADVLARTLSRSGRAKLRMSLGCRTLPDAASANVIGEVPGSEKPDEIVLAGAHLDSWDLGFGAVDDGAGVAIALESARLLAELPRRPRRTLRVVLFANEEMGLRGAHAYEKAHHDELARHVLALESDLGAGKVWGVSFLAGPNAEPAMRAIAAPLSSLGVAPPKPGDLHGSDLWPLRSAGVPVVDLQQDASQYFDVHHTADDTLDRIVPQELDQAVAVTAAFLFGAADANVDFGRIPDEKRNK